MKDDKPLIENYKKRYHIGALEDKNYEVQITQFKCSELDQGDWATYHTDEGRYGDVTSSGLSDAIYTLEFQMTIYRYVNNERKEYSVKDFQRTVFIPDEFIGKQM